jgi:hypothetical protein
VLRVLSVAEEIMGSGTLFILGHKNHNTLRPIHRISLRMQLKHSSFSGRKHHARQSLRDEVGSAPT